MPPKRQVGGSNPPVPTTQPTPRWTTHSPKASQDFAGIGKLAEESPPRRYFFVFATSFPKSNKCSGLKAFSDHRQESGNSTPTKKPISR